MKLNTINTFVTSENMQTLSDYLTSILAFSVTLSTHAAYMCKHVLCPIIEIYIYHTEEALHWEGLRSAGPNSCAHGPVRYDCGQMHGADSRTFGNADKVANRLKTFCKAK